MVSVVNVLGIDKRELLETVEREHGGVGDNLEAAIEVLKSITPAERGGIRAVVPTLEAVAHWCSDILTSSAMAVGLRWGDA
jgi:hypothetical protein